MSDKINVAMVPFKFIKSESGIRRVVEAYKKFLPEFGINVVDPAGEDNYSIMATHAGSYVNSDVLHCHGLYWTADYQAARWEWDVNSNVVATARQAKQITVPSEWVAEVFRRDMRISPHVIPHGIEWDDWQHSYETGGYVLWNKNRVGDVCDPMDISHMAEARPSVTFITTMMPQRPKPNIVKIGLVDHVKMKRFVQEAGVYLSTAKETFGIGVLEAMASGTPVLGYAHGGNLDLVQHGVTGYLAAPGDIEGLVEGLDYCLSNRDVLGANARIIARDYTWQNACKIVADVYKLALQDDPPTVSIVIPTYNYSDKVGRAIESAIKQDYNQLESIIVVDDGSADNGATQMVVTRYARIDGRVKYVRQDNSGVANARNRGISYSASKYICCLDADDAMEKEFIRVCVDALEKDKSLGIAYTGLTFIKPDGSTGLSLWPDQFDYDQQLKRHNQIPTCCVFRREMWERLGGYRQRYAPHGAGSEDAEFWTRAGAYGYNARKVVDTGLFIYSWMTGRVSGDPTYSEPDWLSWHPWVADGQHPFASVATPYNISHPVRQYDEPVVSVVIPVGNKHTKTVIDALDSLEAQTFRKWEAVVVWDMEDSIPDSLKIAYPYVRWYHTNKHAGAGYSRNRGVEISRAPLILFLDADDWLLPNALDELVLEWSISGNIVYSDYLGKAYIDEKEIAAFQNSGRLVEYDKKLGEATIQHYGKLYDCDMAVMQPNPSNMYIWNLITSLVPSAWHFDIGGFDESMPSWEDWDYWIRMARVGKCFSYLHRTLVVYRFATGERRDTGLHEHQNLIEYLQDKYKELPMTPCGGCGGNKTIIASAVPQRTEQTARQREDSIMQSNDDSFVLIQYNHPNRGQHRVVGPLSGLDYGYRGGGERFYVDKRDVAGMPDIFSVIQIQKPAASVQPEKQPAAPVAMQEAAPQDVQEQQSAPEAVSFEDAIEDMYDPDTRNLSVSMVPGITPAMGIELNLLQYHTIGDMLSIDMETLNTIKGIGPARAQVIMNYLRDLDKALKEKEKSTK